MNFAVPSHLIRKALGRTRSLYAAADEVVTVCPAETVLRPPAFYLPGQLDRVRGAHWMDGVEAQMARISQTEIRHWETLAFRLRDAVLAGGSLYANGTRYQLSMDRPPRMPRRVTQEVDEAALVGTPVSDIYFGHFVLDDSATALLARRYGTARGIASRHQRDWPHAHAYRRMMDLTLQPLGDTLLRTAWVFEDHGMNADRRGRFHDIRARIAQGRAQADAATSGPAGSPDGGAVFILRGTSGQALRLLENEGEIAAMLAARGFTIVDPSAETADTIVAKVAGARVAISVEGSALAHALLGMSADGAVITIQPPFRFEHVMKDYADGLGMRYGFVMATGERDRFRVDPDELLRTIELATG